MPARLAARLHDRMLLAALAGLVALVALAAVAVGLPGRARGATVPAAQLAVADLRGHALVLLDTRRGTTRRIDLPGGPHEMVRLPDGRIVLSLEQSGALAVVDPDTGDVAVRTTGGLPHGLALIGDVLIVTDRSADVLRRFELSATAPADWRELTPVPAGHWPHIVAAFPDGSFAVANAGDATLQIGQHLVATSDTPETLAISPAGEVATAGSLGGTVQAFGADGTLHWERLVGGRPVRVAWSPDGDTLAVSLSADGAVALIGPAHVVRTVAVGGAPDGLAFDPTGRYLFVADLAAGRVTVVDLHTDAPIARFDAAQTAGALLLLPPAPSS
jgi:DNA-binding beta-propeller fold protein YncE